MKKLIALAVCFFNLLTVSLTAQGVRSLTGSEWTVFPSKEIPPIAARNQNEELLQERILLMRSTINELTNSLAIANAEAETFKRLSAELNVRLDALGLAKLNNQSETLEQKLLASVRELKLEQTKSLELEGIALELIELLMNIAQETDSLSPLLKKNIEKQMRKTNELLGVKNKYDDPAPVLPSITNGLVVSIKPEISLVIGNIGSQQGVKVGTPFHVLRGNVLIASVLVVDVREKLCGAIIQNLVKESEPVKVGDRLKVITQ